MNLPYLEEQKKQDLEHEISVDEVWNALNGFQNDKTPGDDGFTKEFYKAFFDLLGNALLEYFNAELNQYFRNWLILIKQDLLEEDTLDKM